MAEDKKYFSKTAIDGATYHVKDSEAREDIEEMKGSAADTKDAISIYGVKAYADYLIANYEGMTWESM